MQPQQSRVPPGQAVTRDFPVLHHGGVPRIDLKNWTFRIFGLVPEEKVLAYDEFLALGREARHNDIHCVTGWSKLDNTWEGVPVRAVLALARPLPEARFVMVHAEGGWSANLALADLDQAENLFAYRHNGRDLTPEHGWPLRLVVPHLYFWKSAKWVRGLEFMAEDRPGFWERNGYHMRGDPWKEERYAEW